MPVVFPPGMAGHPGPTLRATSLSLQGEPADIGKGCSRPTRRTGGQEIGWGSRILRPRAKVQGGGTSVTSHGARRLQGAAR
jgi:hypothetical protein